MKRKNILLAMIITTAVMMLAAGCTSPPDTGKNNGNGNSNTGNSKGLKVTAQKAYKDSLTVAQKWASDAYLIQVNAITGTDEKGKSDDWQFFFSSASKTENSFSVGWDQGEIIGIKFQPFGNTLRKIDEGWLDSDKIVPKIINGGLVLDKYEISMTSADQGSGSGKNILGCQTCWSASNDAGKIIYIDAYTGEVTYKIGFN